MFLTEKGYSGVGIDEILAHAGVPKGGFYHYFRTKELFGLELIEAYNAYFVGMLEASFGNDQLAPLRRLFDFTLKAEEGMARHNFRRGCLVGNLGQEMGVLPEPFRAKLIAVFEDWQERTAVCIRQAQNDGEILPDLDPEALAASFWIGWEGAVLRAKLERRAEPLRIFSQTFLQLIRAGNQA